VASRPRADGGDHGRNGGEHEPRGGGHGHLDDQAEDHRRVGEGAADVQAALGHLDGQERAGLGHRQDG
jgi:hypothetical protein